MPTSSPERFQQRQRLTPSLYKDAIKREVADQPLRSALRSALLAVAAGALAMLLIRTQLTKRARARNCEWMRMR